MDTIPPSIEGVFLTLTAPLGAAQEVSSGFLAGVIPKNQATAQLLTANLASSGLPGGTLVYNTTKDSYAWVYEVVGTPSSTVYTLSQPMADALPLPLDLFNAAEDNTWANGDAFIAYDPIAVNLIESLPTIATYNNTNGFFGQVQALNLVFSSFAGVNGTNASVHVQNDSQFAQCRFDKAINDDSTNDVVTTGFQNCYARDGLVDSQSSDVYSVWLGGVVISGLTSGFAFDMDAIVNCGTGMIFRSPFTDPDDTENTIGSMYIAGKSIWSGTWNFFTGFFNLPLIWGPGVFEVQAATRIAYVGGSAATVFMNTGGITIDDFTTASTFDPTTNVWSGPYPLTAANLDNPAAFNGLALNVANGGGFSGQGTP
jgi:hypothetical protein